MLWHRKNSTDSRTHHQLVEFAPKFAELNDDVLFGEVWSRTNKLGLRDRSLVTVTSHISFKVSRTTADRNVTFAVGEEQRHIHKATKGWTDAYRVAGRGWYPSGERVWAKRRPGTVIHIPAFQREALARARQPTVGLHIWLSRFREKRHPTNGSNRSRTKSMTNSNKIRTPVNESLCPRGSSGISTSVSEARMTAVAAHCETTLGHG